MSTRSLRTIALVLACPLVLPVAGAEAATKKKAVALPTISAVKPLKLGLGDTLTITGRNFIAGKNRNTVVFKRNGGRAIFVKAGSATSRTIKVTVPAKLSKYMSRKAGKVQGTRFRLRVLARRFGKNFTPIKLSPVISPLGGDGKGPGGATPVSAPAAPPAPAGPGDCDADGVTNDVDADDDNDLLSDSEEATLGLNACSGDTDGDGVEDGYEFYSALSLNAAGAPPVPYPGKRPYPNPLDGSDAASDYDGDGLAMFQEQRLWRLVGPRAVPLSYDAGLKNSLGSGLDDDERDADGDGLENWVEFNGPLSSPGWWTAIVKSEPVYSETYTGTDAAAADTDGDGILDGADDQDFDGYSNIVEQQRTSLWTQPFNPCLPDPYSVTCSKHPPVDGLYEPYKTYGFGPYPGGTPIPWPLPVTP